MFQILSQFDQNEQPSQYRPRTENKKSTDNQYSSNTMFSDPAISAIGKRGDPMRVPKVCL